MLLQRQQHDPRRLLGQYLALDAGNGYIIQIAIVHGIVDGGIDKQQALQEGGFLHEAAAAFSEHLSRAVRDQGLGLFLCQHKSL